MKDVGMKANIEAYMSIIKSTHSMPLLDPVRSFSRSLLIFTFVTHISQRNYHLCVPHLPSCCSTGSTNVRPVYTANPTSCSTAAARTSTWFKLAYPSPPL